MGTSVAEIQSLTEVSNWRYVDSANNPADDITRGSYHDHIVGTNALISCVKLRIIGRLVHHPKPRWMIVSRRNPPSVDM